MEQIPQLQTAELELQNALTQLVTSKCLTQRSVASVLDMLDVEAEKETENKWTIQELIDEHKLDLCEAFSEQIEEPEPKPERKPHMTWSEASSTVTLLLHLLHTENGDMPEEAWEFLPKLRCYINKQYNNTLKQLNCHSNQLRNNNM